MWVTLATGGVGSAIVSTRHFAVTLLIALACADVAMGQPPLIPTDTTMRPARRGPIEWREEWLLTQPRLTLPATSPDLLAPGETELRVDFDWGNDFGWSQDAAGEVPGDRRFLVDAEHGTLGVALRQGMTRRLEVGLRLPVHWRGGGLLDGVIEWFHAIGFPNNGRDEFLQDQIRVEGRHDDFRPLMWTGSSGVGLGKVELDVRAGLTGSAAATGWRTSIIGRVALPTATGTFSGGGLEVGAQLLAAHPVGRSVDLFLGAGGVHFPTAKYQGLVYKAIRGHGFFAVEWRPWHAVSLLAQLDAASRHVDQVADYPGIHSYMRLGAKLQLEEHWELEAGFGENIKHQQATTDFGIRIGLTRRF